MLASIVTHAPKSKVARAALLEMKSATRLFQEAAELGGRATRFAVRAYLPLTDFNV